MKNIATVAVILLTIGSVYESTNNFNDGDRGGLAYKINLNIEGGSSAGELTTEGGAGTSGGGFQQSDHGNTEYLGGGSVSGVGFQSDGEHGVERLKADR